jgi:hypothetical protein
MDARESSSGRQNSDRSRVNGLAGLYEYAKPGHTRTAREEDLSLRVRLLRWLFPDVNRRRARRFSSPGLVAYYWTGGSTHCYDVANISATGLYLRTKERWAPETLIQMTLQKNQAGEVGKTGSISVLSEVVRWGEDGTGFNFVLRDRNLRYEPEVLPGDVVDRKSVEKFLKQLELVDQS